MNKLFTKIAKLSLGLAMAAGVGVALSDNKVISTAHAADTFEKVTSFSVGDQIIFVNESKKYEMSSGAGSNASAYTTSPAGTYVMTVEAGNGGTGYSFKNGSNYISWSTGNNLATSTTKNNASSWTISTSESGNFKLANVGTTARILQFNSSSPKFAPYTSTQTAFQIYKKVSAKTLSSISVSGATTSFTQGDTFSFGGTVTATYSDSTTSDVTSSATFDGYNMSTAGNQTVTVSYTEGGTTKTASYSITVAAHTHTYSDAWSSDDTHHWHAATCGHDLKDSYAEHTFGEWQTDTEASCTTDGSKHHVCSVCGKSVSETISATGHTYVNHICSVCGAEEPLEVTFAYPSGSTTNMTGNNDAATLGQSASAWSVVGYKGGNNNYPGLNTAGEIRLYGSSQNYIIIKTLAATGTRYLTTVTISSSQNHYSLYAGEANFTSAIASSTESSPYSYSLGENVTAFTIRNESSTQSKIQSITVAYSDHEVETYTVSFNGNGASSSMSDVEDVIGSYTLPANGFTVPSGTRFGGWKAGNAGDLIAAGDSYEVTEDVTFWAQWINVSTISFNANGGTGSMSNETVDTGESYTLPANGFTAPSSKAFAGWKVGNAGETLAAGASYTVNLASIVLYAQWSDVYTVSFNGNGADGSMSSVTSGADYTLPVNGFTVPSGKQFAGWKVGNAGETLAANSSYTLAGDITLYAQWEDRQALGGLTNGEYYYLIIGEHVLKASTFDIKGADTYTTSNATTDGLARSDAWYFTSTGTDDQWYIRSSSANDASYLGVSKSDNNALVSSETSDSWNISESDDHLIIRDTSQSRHLSYTSNSGSYIRTYLSTSTIAPSAVRFVKYQDLTLTITGKTSEYTDTSVTLSSNAGASTSWEITTNPGSIGSLSAASGASTSLSVSGAGTVVVTASADGYVSTTHTVTFTVRPSYFMELSGECTNGTSALGINGKTFMVTVDESNLAGNIDWEVTSGTVSGITSDDEGFMATFASTGTVTISATDLGHTDNTQSISFTVIESLNEIYAKNDGLSSIAFTSTGKTGASAEADDGTTWSIISDANEQNGDATSGIHYGSNNSTSGYVTYIEMTTSDITDVVTNVKVNARAVNSDAHLTVTVGGTTFKCSGETSVDPDNTSKDYEFTGSGSGTITISLAKESSAIKALYIGGVVVKSTSAVASPIANTNATVQQEVLAFVATMNTDLSVCSNSATLSTSVWSTLAGKFETAAGNSSDEALFRRMFKYADATPRAGDGSATTGDTLQNALARYNYVLEKYGTINYADFLHRAEANKVTPKVSLSNNMLGLLTGTTSNIVAIIVIISMVSVTAIGGYFFLRKRKENI